MDTNICSFCGHHCPAESKFCNECGTAFQVLCRFCEHTNPGGSRFCNQCGGQLNLLPCPRCGAVSDVTATTCYKCHGQLWGRSSGALASQSPFIPESAPSPDELPQSDGEPLGPKVDDISDHMPDGGLHAPDSPSYAPVDTKPLPGKHLRRIDNASTLAEIADIFDELSGGSPDARGAASPVTRPERPEDALPRNPRANDDWPDRIDPPPFSADADRASAVDFQPPVTEEPGRAVAHTRTRMIFGAAALAGIAAVGYYTYSQLPQDDSGLPNIAKSQHRMPGDSIGGGVTEQDLAKFKTIPAREVLAEATGNREKRLEAETTVTPASSVEEVPGLALASKPQHVRETEGSKQPVNDEQVAVPEVLASQSTEPAAAVVPEPASEAAVVAARASPEQKAGRAGSGESNTANPTPTLSPKTVRATSAKDETVVAARSAAPSATQLPARPATSVPEKQAPASNAQKTKRAPAPAKLAAASAYPVKPSPDLAPIRLSPPEQGSEGRPAPCPGSYFTALWTNCVGGVTLPDGNHYVGEFRDGLYHGHGTATLPDGETYVGALKDGKRDGQGTATYPDGRKYVGEWKDDKAHGKGTATYADGREYTGEFRQGRREGQGTVTYPDGRSYSGAWQNDRYNGQGTAVYPEGTKYVGGFRNGLYDGQGTFINRDGSKYVGDFQEGRYQGRGAVTFPDKSRYVGEFKNGHYDGQGTVTYADGFKYVGEWKADKANGQGTAHFPDGRKYVGEWKDDKPNGRGTEYNPDGQTTRSGVWKDGKFIGGR